MSWETFYLISFLVGFFLSALSFFGGAIRLPHFHFHMHGHAPAVGGRIGTKLGGKPGVSAFNFGTIAAFLAWFGGIGYLLERYSNIWVYLGLVIAALSGLGGASIVFWFLMKLASHEAPLDPADFEMVGVLGQVASPIRAGGTGEMIFSRNGSRCATPVRSEDGGAIPRGTEVVVTRFEKGIAYVRRWEEMSGERY